MIENITFEVTMVNPDLQLMERVFRADGHQLNMLNILNRNQE